MNVKLKTDKDEIYSYFNLATRTEIKNMKI